MSLSLRAVLGGSGNSLLLVSFRRAVTLWRLFFWNIQSPLVDLILVMRSNHMLPVLRSLDKERAVSNSDKYGI